MRHKTQIRCQIAFLTVFGATLLAMNRPVQAHCDGMDGPVVKAAQNAFETSDVNVVLVWVQPNDEAEIKAAFERALVVRKLSTEAKNLADLYFFETLVRIHRAGEGASYTGLKPAGRDLGSAIPAVDRAVETGSAETAAKLVIDLIRSGVNDRFKAVMDAKNFEKSDVAGGRKFVRAYVRFVHYVEGIYQAAKGSAEDRGDQCGEHAGNPEVHSEPGTHEH